ncbi:hypothetical protein IC235_13880 [Hymenobacter sp. BT664]|uniref:DUF4168 domain-containing protein n=1 Tax=Hymenobacter montanus TaxID=2771359 RepID=A0A927BFB8_9BACT|nr:hypothetical protein [Hymenobacter montanus]MBD2768977.1 hypothetical protein [Hymenobacter montanus]
MIKLPTSALIFLLSLGAFGAHAQTPGRLPEQAVTNPSPGNDALTVTREMTSRLHLNEGQFLHLLPLNRTKLAQLNSINQEYKNDEALRAAKTSELEAQYELDCSRILTPSQLSQLQQAHGRPTPTIASTSPGVG